MCLFLWLVNTVFPSPYSWPHYAPINRCTEKNGEHSKLMWMTCKGVVTAGSSSQNEFWKWIVEWAISLSFFQACWLYLTVCGSVNLCLCVCPPDMAILIIMLTALMSLWHMSVSCVVCLLLLFHCCPFWSYYFWPCGIKCWQWLGHYFLSLRSPQLPHIISILLQSKDLSLSTASRCYELPRLNIRNTTLKFNNITTGPKLATDFTQHLSSRLCDIVFVSPLKLKLSSKTV